MRRVICHLAILFGCLTLITIGMLAYARRDAASDWIIFSVQRHYSGTGTEIYRVLSDGTHTQKFASTDYQYPSFWWMPPSPGWLVLYDSDLGERRLQLIHLMGYTKPIIRVAATSWPSIYYYDRQHHLAYLTISDNNEDTGTLWTIDVNTGERTPFELPLNLNQIRYTYDSPGYIYWSDHASAGDLYAMQFATPPQVIPLTTGGKVLQDDANIWRDGWLYYLVDDGDPYVQLYRMRGDGTDAAMVAEQILLPDDVPSFGGGETEFIYYWSGDPEQPHLVQAKPDGSQPMDLPITPFAGFGMGWSPNREWFYYAEEITDPNAGSPSSSDPFAGTPIAFKLRRVNMQTGEDQLVWDGGRPYTITWSADGQTLLVVAENEQGYSYQTLYRMRPDGSEPAVLVDNLRSSSLTQIADVDLVVLGTWGQVGSELHTLDLETLEIRPLHEDAPPRLMRQILATLPMPESDWRAGWLIGIGIAAVGVGIIAQRRG